MRIYDLIARLPTQVPTVESFYKHTPEKQAELLAYQMIKEQQEVLMASMGRGGI